MEKPNISNLPACIEDVRRAVLDGDPGPADPTDFHALRGRLTASRHKLPPLYRVDFCDPFLSTLDALGPAGFAEILVVDPYREHVAGLLLDMAHAILQNGEGYEELATDGFQEVISDLYDGFLSEEDRQGVEPPDEGTTPPLVKWGSPEFGPYTFTAPATANFGAKAALVSLPPAHTRRGLLAWSALGHETAGHDILHADRGLRADLSRRVRRALKGLKPRLDDYWADKIDETASDVLGILNMGPAAGIGLIGYFRGLEAAYSGVPRLSNEGWRYVAHPIDILRGYLAASTVSLLSFGGAKGWSTVIEEETDKDLTQIRISGQPVTADAARKSAEIVAQTVATTKVPALENHALIEIQDWRDDDEQIVADLSKLIGAAGTIAPEVRAGFYAAHVVAAAITTALANGADCALAFSRMLALLKPMHDHNPSWGPMYVRHPGNLRRHRAYDARQRTQALLSPARDVQRRRAHKS